MEKNELFERVIKHDGKFFFIVNTKLSKVFSAYYGNKEIADELDYHSFAVEFAKVYGLILDFEAKTLRFLKNLNPGNESFTITVSYNTLNNKTLRILYSGVRINEDEILILTSPDTNTENSFDELTKTHSRGYLMGVVKEAIARNESFVLMIVDVDNFKEYNDMYGHMFGDIVLIEIVSAIKDFLGSDGYVSRIGGDEFLICYKADDSYDTVYDVCKRLKESIAKASISSARNVKYTVTIGCSRFPNDGSTYELLFRKADKALYRGKRKARDCFVIYLEENCGPVSENDEIDVSKNKIDKAYNSNTNISLITMILEILNKNQSLNVSVDEILPLIGNYFTLDRVFLIESDPETDKIIDTKIWYNPRSTKKSINVENGDMDTWREALGEANIVKLNQVSANSTIACYNSLVRNNVSAIVAFELRGEGKPFGIINFEMTSVNRFWQQTDVSTLMLIARILSIKFNKEYNTRKQLEDLYFDKLTGAYNYNKWLIEVNDYIKVNQIESYTILDLSLHEFKSLSNVIGSKRTDELLIYMVELLEAERKNNDYIFCRSGDARFVIFVPKTDDTAITIFNELMIKIKDHDIWSKYIILTCGASLGNRGDDISVIEDQALLTRKRKKVNESVVYFDREVFELENRKMELQMHMYEALANNEFLVYLQPKIDIKTGSVAGAEALSRWNYKNNEMIYPDVFIPIFEETGFIVNLDYYVFEQVCKLIEKLEEEKKIIVPISVNVSRYVPDFNYYLDELERIRTRYGLKPSLIEFEITERMYTANTESISSFIDLLHEKGYLVAMDDFGAGYSNFTTLSHLNFDIIKLDKELCNNVNNKKEIIILKYITELVKSLNMKVLCEGVEDVALRDYLKEIGCDYIQGYLYDKPLPIEDFIKKYVK